MNKKYKIPLIAVSCALAACALSACEPQPDIEVTEEPPLTGAAIGGDFTLTDQDGQKVSFSDFDGQYRILYFGYTFCPDVCPVDVQKLMMGLRVFEKSHPERGAKIQPIFVSIDPERDTPEVLKQFVTAFHPRLIGLTGSTDEVKAAADKYLIMYQKQNPNAEGGYLVDHSRQAYLIGPRGEPVALLPYDGTAEEVASEINRWTK